MTQTALRTQREVLHRHILTGLPDSPDDLLLGSCAPISSRFTYAGARALGTNRCPPVSNPYRVSAGRLTSIQNAARVVSLPLESLGIFSSRAGPKPNRTAHVVGPSSGSAARAVDGCMCAARGTQLRLRVARRSSAPSCTSPNSPAPERGCGICRGTRGPIHDHALWAAVRTFRFLCRGI
jgi:hypothetical protein